MTILFEFLVNDNYSFDQQKFRRKVVVMLKKPKLAATFLKKVVKKHKSDQLIKKGKIQERWTA